MLGYRMFFTVAGNRADIVRLALEQLHAWLRSKNYDADALTPQRWTQLAPDVEGLLLEHFGQDGSHSVRARIIETRTGNRWISELTVHVPKSLAKPSWVWLDIDAPDPDDVPTRKTKWTGTPRLARGVLDVLDARDGVARLASAPQPVMPVDLDNVIDAIRDPDRRGLLFLAGSNDDLPFPPWMTMVGKLLKETVGLAAAYVLDAEATALLGKELGPMHAVAPGTIRTYLPGVEPESEIDAIRHRVLTTQRILREDAGPLARLLGWKARESGIDRPLPRIATRVASQLQQMEDQVLLDRLMPAAHPAPTLPPQVPDAGLESAEVSAAAPETETPVPDRLPERAGTSEPSVADGVEHYLALRSLVQSVLGAQHVDTTALDEIARLATLGRQAEKAHADLAVRLEMFNSRVAEADEARRELLRRLEDEQLEHAAAAQRLVKAEELVRSLRGLLAKAGQAEAAWTTNPTEDQLFRPESFADLLHNMSRLSYVTFTGDWEVTFGLDAHDPMGTWAAKAWEALLALDDYARASIEGRCDRDVDGYLRQTPDGCRGFSANRHARDESEDVKSNPRFRERRMLPVPPEVDPSGVVFMAAHFKIAKAGMISPRLHYWDDTRRTGLVYVGYLGPHLPTKQTN
jgi:hypothetical protein